MARENTKTARALAALLKGAGKPMAKIVEMIADASEVSPPIATNYYNWLLRQNYPEVAKAEKEKGAYERATRGGRVSDKPKAKATVSASVKKADAGKKSKAPAKRAEGAKVSKAKAKPKTGSVKAAAAKRLAKSAGKAATA